MAGSKANFLSNKLLDHVLSAVAYTPPVTLYFALFTVSPTSAGGGTEVTGGSYARIGVANNAVNFPAAAAQTKNNGTVITFVTASASWGVVLAIGVFDALTAGNMLYWTTITSKTIDPNDTVSIPISNFTVTES